MNKIIVFEVSGEYAHFRKHYTTSSPLTFSFPPRTTICGLIAAIIGLDKDNYLDHFSKEEANIALCIKKPITKIRFAENLIDTKTAYMMSKIVNRTQIRFEFIKEPLYRIYLSHKDEIIYSKILEMLQNKKCVYTPCLGLSEHIANVEFIGEMEQKQLTAKDFTHINSVVPFSENKQIKINYEIDKEYFTETMPNEMDSTREVKEYLKIIFERTGSTIQLKGIDFRLLSNDERIIFL